MKGYFKLTQDVKNPRPDRRSKRRIESAVMWPAGTVVYIHDTRESEDGSPRGYIRFTSGSQVMFDLAEKQHQQYPEWVQGNGILACVEPAPRTLSMALKESYFNAEQLLALLISSGKVTLLDIDAFKDDEGDHDELFMEHGI